MEANDEAMRKMAGESMQSKQINLSEITLLVVTIGFFLSRSCIYWDRLAAICKTWVVVFFGGQPGN